MLKYLHINRSSKYIILKVFTPMRALEDMSRNCIPHDNHSGGSMMRTCPIRLLVCAIIAFSFVSGCVVLPLYAESKPPEPVPLPQWENLEPVDVENLSVTKISGVLDAPIQRGLNQVF
jgi:hypothetical protein